MLESVEIRGFKPEKNSQIVLFQVIQSTIIHSNEWRFDFSKKLHLRFG